MSIDRIALDRAVDAFLDIPFQGMGWAPALEAFDTAIGALGTIVLSAVKGRIKPDAFPMSPSLSECARQYVDENWIQADVRQNAVKKFLACGVATDYDIFSREGKRHSAYFQDFIHKHGADEWAGLHVDICGEICCVSIQKPLGTEPFAPEELEALVSVAPRMSMVTSMLQQIDRARLGGLIDALDAMTTPAFLLNRSGEVIRFNSAGHTVLSRGMSLRERRLVARGPDNEVLQKRINNVFYAADTASPLSGLPLQIRRQTGRPLLVRVQRLKTDVTLANFGSACGIVTVTDPDRHLASVGGVLQSMFALTGREAQLVVLLVECNGITRAAADRANITYETFRTHLKKIREKTSIRNTGELIGFVSKIGSELSNGSD